MAYTYDDFLSAAKNAGMMEKFSDDDLAIAQNNPEYGLSALKLQQDLQGATTTEQKLLAQEAINQLRTSYSDQLSQASTSPTAGGQNAYQKMLEEVSNSSSFRYDPSTDENFGYAKKSYLREGDRARADTLAKVSAATGGAPSSYAVTAAQQAGDYYSTKFADLVPGFEQTAYQKYMTEFEKQRAEDQQKWQNAFNLYKTLGYATPEIAEILGLNSGAVNVGGGTGDVPFAGNPAPGIEGNTGTVTTEQKISELQRLLGLPEDGVWGADSAAAVKAMWGADSLEDAWNQYQAMLQGTRSSQGSTGTVDNQGILMLQQQLGVPLSGVWDERTALAAQDKWGTSSAYDAMNAYMGSASISNKMGNGWIAIGNTR